MPPENGGPHLSSRDSQSVFETILPARPAAVRLLGRALAFFVEVIDSKHGEQVFRSENARAFTMAPPTTIAMLAITSGYQLE